MDPSKWQTILDALDSVSSLVPERVAFRFLEDGKGESERLTIGELHLRALAIADALIRTGKTGDRARGSVRALPQSGSSTQQSRHLSAAAS